MEYLLATRSGLLVADATGEVARRVAGFEGRAVTSVAASGRVALAGTTEGLWRSADAGRTWAAADEGLTERHVRWLACHPDEPDLAFDGTEPAAIFISEDGGETWAARPEVAALREEHGWWLPYSPGAGCVRGFAFHGDRAYAAVEVGGLLRSDDRGATWRLVPGSDGRPRTAAPAADRLHADVHSVAVHPSSPDLIFAPTGGGFFRSRDGGATWDAPYANCYVRAVWVDPADPDHLILGPSAGPDGRDGRIERTRDGGRQWEIFYGPEQRNMVERFAAAGEMLYAVMSRGNLLAAPLATLDWEPFLPEVTGVNDLAVLGG